GFVAASLYAAIRIHEFPKLLEDVSDASMISNHTLFRSLGLIIRDILPILNLNYHPISAKNLVFLFGCRLELPEKIKLKAIDLLNETSKKGLNIIGKDPKGLAAAALYLVARNTEFNKTQVEVADAARVTEVTIRSRIKDIKIFIDK
ncbi:MAG: transcription initiation factor IIB, partial [Promethearchaeota archaeon]